MQQLHKKQYKYNPDKDLLLMDGRDVCFQDLIDIITSGNALGIRKHPNTEKYPNQHLIYVPLKEDVYVVPCVFENENTIFLKTAFPSREARKLFFPGKKTNYRFLLALSICLATSAANVSTLYGYTYIYLYI